MWRNVFHFAAGVFSSILGSISAAGFLSVSSTILNFNRLNQGENMFESHSHRFTRFSGKVVDRHENNNYYGDMEVVFFLQQMHDSTDLKHRMELESNFMSVLVYNDREAAQLLWMRHPK